MNPVWRNCALVSPFIPFTIKIINEIKKMRARNNSLDAVICTAKFNESVMFACAYCKNVRKTDTESLTCAEILVFVRFYFQCNFVLCNDFQEKIAILWYEQQNHKFLCKGQENTERQAKEKKKERKEMIRTTTNQFVLFTEFPMCHKRYLTYRNKLKFFFTRTVFAQRRAKELKRECENKWINDE